MQSVSDPERRDITSPPSVVSVRNRSAREAVGSDVGVAVSVGVGVGVGVVMGVGVGVGVVMGVGVAVEVVSGVGIGRAAGVAIGVGVGVTSGPQLTMTTKVASAKAMVTNQRMFMLKRACGGCG